MCMVYNYEYDQLAEADKPMAMAFVSLYLVLVACVCLNLYIALLTEAFSRVFGDATACTYLEEARRLLIAQYKFGLTHKYENYLFENCSPLVSYKSLVFDITYFI